jgi:hypothetical protein
MLSMGMIKEENCRRKEEMGGVAGWFGVGVVKNRGYGGDTL